MTKRITIGAKPAATIEKDADQWVKSRPAGEVKRLTLDVPVSLHRRIKIQCAVRGTKMTDEITALLEKHFPDRANQ